MQFTPSPVERAAIPVRLAIALWQKNYQRQAFVRVGSGEKFDYDLSGARLIYESVGLSQLLRIG